MKKASTVGLIAVGIGIILLTTSIFSSDSSSPFTVIEEKEMAYHITLADPDLYNEGIFTDSFEIKSGSYQFRFTPSGDSPKTLSVSLSGDSFSFSEDFRLEGTASDTGISVYYTWDYLGKKGIQVLEDQRLQIVINPHQNLLGPVSVDLISILMEN